MKPLKILFSILLGDYCVENILEEYVHRPKVRVAKGVLITSLNIITLIRSIFFGLYIYHDDIGWLKYDFFAQWLTNFQLDQYLLVSTFLVFIFIIILSYISCFNKTILNIYVTAHELFVINNHKIYECNQDLWHSMRAKYLDVKVLLQPWQTIQSLWRLYHQAYRFGVIEDKQIQIDNNFHHFPVSYRLFRVRGFLIGGICQFSIYAFQFLQFLAFIILIYLIRTFIFEKGIICFFQIVLNLCYARFLTKILLSSAGSVFTVMVAIILALKHIENNLASFTTKTRFVWQEMTRLFRDHARMFNYLLQLEHIYSQYTSLFFWFTIEVNVVLVTNFLLGRITSMDKIFMFSVILFLQVLLMNNSIMTFLKATQILHRAHVYYPKLQLKPCHRRMPPAMKIKLMTYYERLNTDHMIAARIFGLGPITFNTILNYLFLYFMYIFFAINLIRNQNNLIV